jgi:glycyl-tRNA synthetase beta chain
MSTAIEPRTLLVELLTEELPPKALGGLGDEFGHSILNGLIKRRLKLREVPIHWYATPRRLAVQIPDVLAQAPDLVLEPKKLMPAKVAYDANGNASTALLKRLEKEGCTLDQLTRRLDGEAEYVYSTLTAKGNSLLVGLQDVLDETIATLRIPKVMTYQRPDGSDQKFVRPAHRLVALHGADIVPVAVLGLDGGRITEGHRFQGERTISLANADEYESKLASAGKVIASFTARRAHIESQLRARAAELDVDLHPDAVYAALLDEVTALTENPAVYVGEFEREFLDVPQECLILTMRTNQKYFPLFDRQGRLRQQFLIVSNMQLDDPKRVVQGNERVVRPRLADAKFFFDQDRKIRLSDRVGGLTYVVYHNLLGTQFERSIRLKRLAAQVADKLGWDVDAAQRAAVLAKADLLTDMVGEFPELQGIMGRYYALHDGEPAGIADAIEQHYWPRLAGDRLPDGPAAICVALADKLETLVGIFGYVQKPSGDRDQYGLRRSAVGILRILTECGLPLNLRRLIDEAADLFSLSEVGEAWAEARKAEDIRRFGNPGMGYGYAARNRISEDTIGDIFAFILERLRGLLREQGYTANEVDAVLSQMPTRIDLVPARLAAVREFSALPEAAALSAANKRIRNILKKADAVGTEIDPALFSDPAERILHGALLAAEPLVGAELAAGSYTAALKALAGLRGEVDMFFEQVLVNADDPKLRANRLALLNRLGTLMNQVADISRLAS